ncbi:hypothetical protein KJ925_03290 [Patescibacteria group bacterium]|nr:hypothetical protein [Patescibacteria group bacterium]
MIPFLDELQALALPRGSFAIFGSGPLAVRGWREAKDLDVLVRASVWDTLAETFPKNEKGNGLQVGHLELFRSWKPWFDDADALIDTTETIEGWPFVLLEHVITWKRAMGREKDQKDLELIQAHLRM